MNKIPFKSKKKQSSISKKKQTEKINISSENKNQNKKSNLTEEEIEAELTRFDFTIKFGPFKGITRKERFERAKRFKLGVDDRILDLINSDKKFEWAHYEYLQ